MAVAGSFTTGATHIGTSKLAVDWALSSRELSVIARRLYLCCYCTKGRVLPVIVQKKPRVILVVDRTG